MQNDVISGLIWLAVLKSSAMRFIEEDMFVGMRYFSNGVSVGW